MRRLAALLILAAACGCSARERANPFDPGNPQTQGRPAGLVALAGYSLVELQWQRSSSVGLQAYEVYRFVAGDTGWVLVGELPPSSVRFGDFELANGVEHRYRLYYVFAEGRSLPAEDTAIPGPLRPWVADFAGALVRLTADGRHVAERYNTVEYDHTVDVDVDPYDGRVWSSSLDGHVLVHNPSSGTVETIAGLADPGNLAVDRATHTGWIVEAAADRLIHFDPFGNAVAPFTLAPLDEPIDVAVGRPEGDVWALERNGGRVRAFDSDGTPRWAATLVAPSRIAVDSSTHETWVTSFERGRLVRFSAGGAALDTVSGFAGPIGVCMDARRRRVWVADALGDALVALRRDGTVEFRVPGLSEVREVAVDPNTGNAWATVPGAGGVVVVSPTGAVLQRLQGLGIPFGIALDDVLRRGESAAQAPTHPHPASRAAREPYRTSATLPVTDRAPWVSRTK